MCAKKQAIPSQAAGFAAWVHDHPICKNGRFAELSIAPRVLKTVVDEGLEQVSRRFEISPVRKFAQIELQMPAADPLVDVVQLVQQFAKELTF
ncbi:MAG: hypothetical protein RL226_81, partial [Bacteroidota bacterium]